MANTTNLYAELPEDGGSYDDWGVLLLAFYALVDRLAGTHVAITATGGDAVLDDDQNASAVLRCTGSLVSNLIVKAKDGRARVWLLDNSTSGAFSVTVQNAAGSGASVTVSQGKAALVYSDGTNCRLFDLSTISGSLGAGTVAFAAFASGVVLDEDDMSSNSATAVPSQQSVKAYVDASALSSTLPSFVGSENQFIGNDGATAGWFTAAEILGYTPANVTRTINPQTGTSYTLVLADAGKLVTLNNASNINLTVPPNSSVAFPIGTQIDLLSLGIGIPTLVEGAGVTVNSKDDALSLTGQFSAATLVKLDTNVWSLVGDLDS